MRRHHNMNKAGYRFNDIASRVLQGIQSTSSETQSHAFRCNTGPQTVVLLCWAPILQTTASIAHVQSTCNIHEPCNMCI
jgi:hypothetical protein